VCGKCFYDEAHEHQRQDRAICAQLLKTKSHVPKDTFSPTYAEDPAAEQPSQSHTGVAIVGKLRGASFPVERYLQKAEVGNQEKEQRLYSWPVDRSNSGHENLEDGAAIFPHLLKTRDNLPEAISSSAHAKEPAAEQSSQSHNAIAIEREQGGATWSVECLLKKAEVGNQEKDVPGSISSPAHAKALVAEQSLQSHTDVTTQAEHGGATCPGERLEVGKQEQDQRLPSRPLDRAKLLYENGKDDAATNLMRTSEHVPEAISSKAHTEEPPAEQSSQSHSGVTTEPDIGGATWPVERLLQKAEMIGQEQEQRLPSWPLDRASPLHEHWEDGADVFACAKCAKAFRTFGRRQNCRLCVL
jgi:hypothetical protein